MKTDLGLSFIAGILRRTRSEPGDVQLLADVELLEFRRSGRIAHLDGPLATRVPPASRLCQIRDQEPELEHPGNRVAASAGPVLARQQFLAAAREPGHADPAEEHADPGPDQVS